VSILTGSGKLSILSGNGTPDKWDSS